MMRCQRRVDSFITPGSEDMRKLFNTCICYWLLSLSPLHLSVGRAKGVKRWRERGEVEEGGEIEMKGG